MLIDKDDHHLDVAVLSLPEPCERIEWIGKRYFPTTSWPPEPPKVGDEVGLVGFPGIYREPSTRGLEVRHLTVVDFASSVSDRQVVLADENLQRVCVKHDPNLPDFGSLGGISGAAAYVCTPDRSKFHLAGFVYEAGEGVEATIFIGRASFIRANGSLDRLLMPW
jgi:hypothetical protein